MVFLKIWYFLFFIVTTAFDSNYNTLRTCSICYSGVLENTTIYSRYTKANLLLKVDSITSTNGCTVTKRSTILTASE